MAVNDTDNRQPSPVNVTRSIGSHKSSSDGDRRNRQNEQRIGPSTLYRQSSATETAAFRLYVISETRLSMGLRLFLLPFLVTGSSIVKIFYRTRASATGGRSGRTALDDGSLTLDLAVPGSGKAGANPEQLFAMGYAACFDNALPVAAKQLKLTPSGTRTSVEVGIGQTAEGGYVLDIDLYVRVEGLDEADARRLVEAAHRVCPYSNATHGNIDVRLHVCAA
jgi:Ohr subfamily peroxiredoxin